MSRSPWPDAAPSRPARHATHAPGSRWHDVMPAAGFVLLLPPVYLTARWIYVFSDVSGPANRLAAFTSGLPSGLQDPLVITLVALVCASAAMMVGLCGLVVTTGPRWGSAQRRPRSEGCSRCCWCSACCRRAPRMQSWGASNEFPGLRGARVWCPEPSTFQAPGTTGAISSQSRDEHVVIDFRPTLMQFSPFTMQQGSDTGVCDRTQQVQDEILAAVSSVSACTFVRGAHLEAITTLNVSGKGLTTLQVGDFTGLTHLKRLDLHNNALTTVPADVFRDLTKLEVLDLSGNALTTLPVDVFDNLTKLEILELRDNTLTTLPSGVFRDLIGLETLHLHNNALTTLPAGVFRNLTALRPSFFLIMP